MKTSHVVALSIVGLIALIYVLYYITINRAMSIESSKIIADNTL